MGKAGRLSLWVLGVLALGALTLEVGTRLLGGPKGGRSIYREISRDFEQLKQFAARPEHVRQNRHQVLRVLSVLGAAVPD